MKTWLLWFSFVICAALFWHFGVMAERDKAAMQMEEQYAIALRAVDLAELKNEELKVCTEALLTQHQHGMRR